MSMPSIADVRKALIATPGKLFDLSARETSGDSLFADSKDAESSMEKDAKIIDELQDRLYAHGKRALLVVLQGMDGSGKSGTIKRVFAQTTPLGMQVSAFKAPTAQELSHDFLWRIHAAVPPAGFIGIFDRSHYEDVLIARVRKLVPDDVVEQRYDQINAFEKLLTETGTVVLKCMLNISFDEQGERLKERLAEEHKHWKFNPGDLDDRRDWKLYMDAYETAVQRCSTKAAPWYIIPSDSRTKRSALIARLVRGELETLSEGWPEAKFKAGEFKID